MIYPRGTARAVGDRLAAHAEFWRDRIMLPDTSLPCGTRLLEVGCGTGAVLGVLAGAFPGVTVSGVDVEPAKIDIARQRLAADGVAADLFVADGRALPYPDRSFDHVWIQFVLAHMSADHARDVLREVRRVLAPGGRLTAIEADYRTLRLGPELEPLTRELVRTMDAHGQSDAGEELYFWLHAGGWSDIRPGARHFLYPGIGAASVAAYLADAVAASMPAGDGLEALRQLGSRPEDVISFTLYKTTAQA